MHSNDSTFKRRLEKKITEALDDKRMQLSSGAWVATAAGSDTIASEALRRIGYIRALSDVLELSDAVEREMQGE